ncbi:MAG: efflux RND transporter periplasmic adaptor subunit [Limimaricola sp.]|uniref:efflux RND transporter periplasmic adaptor subunit n=1 Tax=Limimaricola sp. TaxID=2211665 RepID=UPI001DB761AA|nr:efflux RND transporter periplasmic adaptor subunit [Limimaricola sp.]MBI1418603.1 efflux RND transporter periplasmic adaptor subunit [Limimaricola sp.]
MSPLRFAALALCAALSALPAVADTPPRPVVSEIVAPDQLPVRSFTGVIEAEKEAVLAFQTAGRVADLPVQTGDSVADGAVLATLDQVTLQEDVDAAQAGVTSAEASAKAAADNLARVSELAKRGVASQQVLDSAQQANDTAAAQARAARADLARAQNALGFGTLHAPSDGVVLQIAVKPGTVVGAGSPVLTMALGPAREAVLDVPADYLSLLQPGRSFTVTSRVQGAAPITGTLRLVEPVSDATTRSRRIRVSLPGATAEWKIGALVRASLSGDAAPVLTLPQSAIAGSPDAPSVWIVAEGRKAHEVPVTLGPALGGRVVIATGITVGDEVVVKGVHSLTEGQALGGRVQ